MALSSDFRGINNKNPFKSNIFLDHRKLTVYNVTA